MKKIHFIFDKTKKAQNLKKILLKKYKNTNVKKSDCIVVAGGDGHMLKTLKKNYKFNKPFYGINCGTFGFLMNKYMINDLEKKLILAKKTFIQPLETKVKTSKGIRSLLAVNEISLLRQSRQTVSLEVKINNKIIIKKLIGDGILLSTPAGSTAYNLSVHGPILSLTSKTLALTSISAFRPRKWRGKIISDKSVVKIKNLDSIKRPVAAVADNTEVRNVKFLKIKASNKIKICVLYDKNNSLYKKIKAEQLKSY